MTRKNILFLRRIVQPCLLSPIGKLLLWLPLGIVLITGCDLDRDREAEPPVIEKLYIESPIINIQEITTVTAEIPLNEDPDLQYEYEWTTTGGRIKDNGVQETDSKQETNEAKEISRFPSLTAKATYIAPKVAGIYTITLKVCTRYAVVEKAVNVEVTDYIIEFSPYVYWKGNSSEQSLICRFDVEAIRRSPILLRYKIQQDMRQPAANLSINIDETSVTQRPIPIPKASATTDVIISKAVDITLHINRTGQYKLSFTLKTEENVMENAWLLKNIQIIGVEGDFLP